MAREIETTEYLQAARRFIRAAGRRVGESEPEDLADLMGLVDSINEAVSVSVAGLRTQGHSWAAIADALGITRQAAFQRWGGK